MMMNVNRRQKKFLGTTAVCGPQGDGTSCYSAAKAIRTAADRNKEL
jgi:hypothetical protein